MRPVHPHTLLGLISGFLLCIFATFAACVLPAHALSVPTEVIPLLNELHKQGVEVRVDNAQACSRPVWGSYNSPKGTIDICTKGTGQWGSQQTATLRHESHHAAQDCAGRVRGNGWLVPLHQTEDDLMEFIEQSGLSEQTIERIVEVYGAAGASEMTIVLEIETFATERSMTADQVAGELQTWCRAE